MTKVSTTASKVAATDFIGLDLSDKTATYVTLSAEGELVQEGKLKLTSAALRKVFQARPPARLAIEVGGHSPWVSRALTQLGYEVVVANPRQVKLIFKGHQKIG